MKKQILFIQGGGDDGYHADKAIVTTLEKELEGEYEINYPELNSDEKAPDFGWLAQIEKLILKLESDVILVGHSLGASMLLKYLSEKSVNKNVKAVFLISTPFWSGNENWKSGLKLSDNFAQALPHKIQIFFYHSEDDEVVPLSQFNQYKEKVKQANFCEIESGGHQLKNHLNLVAADIKSI